MAAKGCPLRVIQGQRNTRQPAGREGRLQSACGVRTLFPYRTHHSDGEVFPFWVLKLLLAREEKVFQVHSLWLKAGVNYVK